MSQIFMPLDQDQIPEEIQQLAGQLIMKIEYLYPGLKIEIDDRNINYSTKVDMDILSQCLLEIGALPESKSRLKKVIRHWKRTYWMELEQQKTIIKKWKRRQSIQ